MAKRPSRPQMCNWLSGELFRVARITPSNPADIKAWIENGRSAEKKIRALGFIAADLGWHADADLDAAWERIQQYDAEAPRTDTEDER